MRRGQEAAPQAGAALGGLGLLAFAGMFSLLVKSSLTAAPLAAALLAWLLVSVGAWLAGCECALRAASGQKKR